MKKQGKSQKQFFKLDDIIINRNLLEKFVTKETTKKINNIDDLSELQSKSQNELFSIISQMMKNKTFFKYCYSLLININPGPEYVYDYLNLKDWLLEQNNDNKKKDEKKPHLYSFMKYVYETMISENKNQVVSLLGPLGSGKTFNLIHIMEYFCTLHSPENLGQDNFDLIHKSIQFIHILSSTFREYNLESSSCGLLLTLGFNSNNLICNFDIEAQILDFTLPFNENGRTFSVLYALIRGANDNLKRKCKLPFNYNNLFNLKTKKKNFFINDKKKEKLELNDLEIFNRFYSLLKYFKFTQAEIIDIINCFGFILNLNDLMIVQTKGGNLKNISFYEIQIGITTKKLAKNLGIYENSGVENFEKKLKENKFKSMKEMDIFIQGLIKQTYYIVFEYILDKVKAFISNYFSNLNYENSINNSNSKRKKKEIKYIYFIDFPGEVEERTLGGYTINIAHECLNMYSASGYYEIVEKILLENVLLKRFKPLKSYMILSNCFNKGGILDNFSTRLNQDNFNLMKENIVSNQNIYNCYQFPDIKKPNETEYIYYCSFSNKKVSYNYDFLYNEAKSIIYNPQINDIFSLASNIIISQMNKSAQHKLQSLKTFYNYYVYCLQKFFEPIKDYKPFVVYCLHSNDSHKYFFSVKDEKKLYNEKDNNSDLYLKVIKHSMIPAILNWDWFGYKEWISLDDFLQEYEKVFESVKNRIVYINNFGTNKDKLEDNNMNFKNLEKKDKVKCILEVLSRENDYAIGENYILMKPGTLKKLTVFLNSMIDTAEELSKNLSKRLSSSNNNLKINNSRKNNITDASDKRKTKSKDENNNHTNISNKSRSKKNLNNFEKQPLPKKKNIKILENNIYKEQPNNRRNLLKEQCSLNIICNQKGVLKLLNNEEKNEIMKSKYLNINSILDKKKEKNSKEEKSKLEELINYQDEKMVKNIPTKNNTIISDPVFFNRVKSLFEPSKFKNVKLFDYSENIDLIIRIQTFFRNILGQRKYRILKYISYRLIQIQKFIRGLITRKRFKFFVKCSKSVLLIQKIYKKRYKLLKEKATKIQRYYRYKVNDRAERDKLILKKKLEQQKEKFNYINVDKVMDKVLRFSIKEKEMHNMILNIGKNEPSLEKETIRKSVNIDVTNNLKKETKNESIIDLLLYSKLPDDLVSHKKKLKRSKSDIYKIEDKLIHQGIIFKQKREKLEKTKELENSKAAECIPKLSKKNEKIMKKYPDNFLKRMEYFQLFKQRNLENLRNKNYIDISNELKFEPEINNNEPYYNIQSKYFNIYNMDKSKENINKMNINNQNIHYSFQNKEKDFNESTWKENLRDGNYSFSGQNNSNPQGNKLLNNKDIIKNIGKIYNKFINKEIWPKNMKCKFLKSERNETSKNNK